MGSQITPEQLRDAAAQLHGMPLVSDEAIDLAAATGGLTSSSLKVCEAILTARRVRTADLWSQFIDEISAQQELLQTTASPMIAALLTLHSVDSDDTERCVRVLLPVIETAARQYVSVRADLRTTRVMDSMAVEQPDHAPTDRRSFQSGLSETLRFLSEAFFCAAGEATSGYVVACGNDGLKTRGAPQDPVRRLLHQLYAIDAGVPRNVIGDELSDYFPETPELWLRPNAAWLQAVRESSGLHADPRLSLYMESTVPGLEVPSRANVREVHLADDLTVVCSSPQYALGDPQNDPVIGFSFVVVSDHAVLCGCVSEHEGERLRDTRIAVRHLGDLDRGNRTAPFFSGQVDDDPILVKRAITALTYSAYRDLFVNMPGTLTSCPSLREIDGTLTRQQRRALKRDREHGATLQSYRYEFSLTGDDSALGLLHTEGGKL